MSHKDTFLQNIGKIEKYKELSIWKKFPQIMTIINKISKKNYKSDIEKYKPEYPKSSDNIHRMSKKSRNLWIRIYLVIY